MSSILISDEAYKYDQNKGAILVLAGPGTGKTWQLAQRIKFLTESKNIPPEHITVLTFTNEAAKEMRAKLKKQGGNEYIPDDKRPDNIRTMHSLGYKILTDNLKQLGLKKNLGVVENKQSKKPIFLDAAISLGFTEIDSKEAMLDRTTANVGRSTKSAQINANYEKILRVCNYVDFDDQITLANKVMESSEKIRNKYSSHAKYLLVDEYQDINADQFKMIALLSNNNRLGLFVVGDDDQSVYNFRGSTPQFIRNFMNNLGGGGTIIQMQTSRRCPKNILECSNAVVVQYDKSNRLDKGSYNYIRTDPGKVVIHDCPSDDREAEIILAIIKQDIQSLSPCENCKQTPKFSYYVLVPDKNYAQKIQEKFRNSGLSLDFKFEENSDGLSTFFAIKKWLTDSNDSILTRRIVDLFIESGSISGIPSSRARNASKLKMREQGLNKIASLWEKVKTDDQSLFAILKSLSGKDALIAEIYGKLDELKTSYENDDLENFIGKVILYVRPWASIKKFFENISNVFFNENSESNIRVLTLRKAKGLQAKMVFIVGLENEVIPRKTKSAEELAEEARILFVGMTRAEEQLHLFHCRKRSGSSTYKKSPNIINPSLFLNCFPKGMHEKRGHPAKR